MHPHEHRLTRRNLMRGALGAGAAVGVGGVAAGCANTTTAIGEGAGGGQPRGQPARRRQADGPARPAAAAHRQQRHLGDHGRQPADQGRASSPRAATLNVFNYADYIWPGLVKRFEKEFDCKVKIATYGSSDEAAAKLSAGAVDFDVVMGLSANQHGAAASRSS